MNTGTNEQTEIIYCFLHENMENKVFVSVARPFKTTNIGTYTQ